jgi:hypothetical protein
MKRTALVGSKKIPLNFEISGINCRTPDIQVAIGKGDSNPFTL